VSDICGVSLALSDKFSKMSDPKVNMFVENEEEVTLTPEAVTVQQFNPSEVKSVTWSYQSGICLLCTGETRISIAIDKLHTLTADGLKTIRRNCETKGKSNVQCSIRSRLCLPILRYILDASQKFDDTPSCMRALRCQKIAVRWKEMYVVCGHDMDSVVGDHRAVAILLA
jgi:hypothetical protein